MAQTLPLSHPELKWLFTAPGFSRDPYANGDFLAPKIADQFPAALTSYVGLGAFEYDETAEPPADEEDERINYGTFSARQLKELLPALGAASKESSIFAFFEAGEREDGKTTPNAGSAFYQTTLAELPSLCFRAGQHETPTYWWSADHSWLIHSDADSPFALLGSSREMAEAVLGKIDFVFERLDPETRFFLGMFDNPKPTR